MRFHMLFVLYMKMWTGDSIHSWFHSVSRTVCGRNVVTKKNVYCKHVNTDVNSAPA